MVTRRTLLLYHFGACFAFVVMGLLSPYVIESFLPTMGKEITLPPLSPAAVLARPSASSRITRRLKAHAPAPSTISTTRRWCSSAGQSISR